MFLVSQVPLSMEKFNCHDVNGLVNEFGATQLMIFLAKFGPMISCPSYFYLFYFKQILYEQSNILLGRERFTLQTKLPNSFNYKC